LRGQVAAVGLVIGSGVAVMVMSLTSVDALTESSQVYYDRYRFADVFASVVRAPESVAKRIEALPGVRFAEPRISRFATLRIDGFEEPAIGRLVSLPDDAQPILNQLVIRTGRSVAANRHSEVVLNEPFANAHSLKVGDTFEAVINGSMRRLSIVGTALSPEFTYNIAPGALMPDDKRFGIIWMSERAMAAAYDLDGAFNDISVTLLPDASPRRILGQIDDLLGRYGGVGAIERKDQISNWFVMNEIAQLRTMSTILPTIFLLVSAFLTNMVLARLIAIERSEIGLLKAFGYRNRTIGWHYIKLVAAMVFFGIAFGAIAGVGLGRYNTNVYAELFDFPILIYRPGVKPFLIGALASITAALIGAMTAVRAAIRLPPAEAMRPPQPPSYQHGRFATSAISRWFDQPTRISLRQIRRWPVRATLTGIGVSLSMGLLVMALQWGDSIDHMSDTFFYSAQRQNVTIGFSEVNSTSVIHEIEHLPGVMHVEPQRVVPVNLISEQRLHRGSVTGIVSDATLQPIYDDERSRDIPMPLAGIVLGTRLAEKLNVIVGDELTVEVLEGSRPVLILPVVRTFETSIGLPAYMNLDALTSALRVRPSTNFVHVIADEHDKQALLEELRMLPTVSAVMLRQAAIESFNNTLAENILIFTGIFGFLATLLTFGVVYNSARIALSERGRELATLRVLGFTRREISYILLGEVGFIVVAALPVGVIAGGGLVWVVAQAFDTELFRLPLVIEPSTFAWSAIVVLLAAAFSAALVRQRVDKLDLISVLKTRE